MPQLIKYILPRKTYFIVHFLIVQVKKDKYCTTYLVNNSMQGNCEEFMGGKNEFSSNKKQKKA